MSARSTIGFGNPYRFNASSSNATNAISILNSANDACRKCWSSLASFRAGESEEMCELLHTSLVVQKMQGGQTPWNWRSFGSGPFGSKFLVQSLLFPDRRVAPRQP